MIRPSQVEDFIPHRAPINRVGIAAALADLGAAENWGSLSIPLPYTRRADETIDTIEIGPYGGTGDWMIYTGRIYGGEMGSFNITAEVARCPGHMVVLVARALHAHLMSAGTQRQADTVEGDILYALGLAAQPAEDARR